MKFIHLVGCRKSVLFAVAAWVLAWPLGETVQAAAVNADAALELPKPGGSRSPSALLLPATEAHSEIAIHHEPQNDVQSALNDLYGKRPMSFEANRGQTDSAVRFLSRGKGYVLYLTDAEAVLALSRRSLVSPKSDPAVLRLRLVDANVVTEVNGKGELSGNVNYFIGADQTKWRTEIPTYAKVQYSSVYPGIDLVYYGNQRQLEYDFIVAPGADPRRIALSFEGCDEIVLEDNGDLLVNIAGNSVSWHKPVIYQDVDGERKIIPGCYVKLGAQQISFEIGEYDATRPLVIDPKLQYSTYLGGSEEETLDAIAVDNTGHVYVTGETLSLNFPIKNAADSSFGNPSEAYITKFGPLGTNVIFSTYLGGSNSEGGRGIAVDNTTNVYMVGFSDSINFPVLNSFQGNPAGFLDAVVVKLNASGSTLLYSSMMGGADDDYASGIALDTNKNVYVVGTTASLNFPTKNAYKSTFRGGILDIFVAKFNPALSGSSSLLYATYLGGDNDDEGHGIAVDLSARTYVTGSTSSTDFPFTASAIQTNLQGFFIDAFVTKLNPSLSGLSSLVYSTYLGGNDHENLFAPGSIAVDTSGNAYVVGTTGSTDFPGTATGYQPNAAGGFSDFFFAKLNSNATALVKSTYFGGSQDEFSGGVAIDASGNAYIGGYTSSPNFPVSGGAFQSVYGGGASDAVAVKFNTLASGAAFLVSSTFLGGGGGDEANDIAADSSGNQYLAGITTTNGFPTTVNAFDTSFGGVTDGFVAKIIPSADVAVSSSDSPDPAKPGDNITYSLIVTNRGELSATSVVLTNILPPTVSYISATPSQGNCSQANGVVTCNLGTIANGAKAAVTILVDSSISTILTNRTTVGASQPDPITTNNASTATTIVGAVLTVAVPFPDLPETTGSQRRFLISRTGSTEANLTVNYTISGSATPGSDYSSLSGSATIISGASGVYVPVTVIDDATAECDETVVLTLQPSTNYILGIPKSNTITIFDNEPFRVTAVASIPTATELNASQGRFTISRCSSNSAPLTVNYSIGGTASNGVDYSTIAKSVVIPGGAPSANVTITPLSDARAEGDETVILTVTAGSGYTVSSPSSATVIVKDLPYDAWRLSKFGVNANNLTISGQSADPDKDGNLNLFEYYLNMNPNAPDLDLLPKVTIEGGFLTLTYRVNKAATDVVATVEIKSALTGIWTSGPSFTSAPIVVSDDGTTQIRKVQDLTPATNSVSRFMRLKVSSIP